MKAKLSVVMMAIFLLVTLSFSLTGCNFKKKPSSADNPASETAEISTSEEGPETSSAEQTGQSEVLPSSEETQSASEEEPASSEDTQASSSEEQTSSSDEGGGSDEPEVPEDKTLRILFLGNSLVFYNDMPTIFENIALNAGKKVYVDSITQGSSTMTKFASRETDIGEQAYNYLTTKQWDYVIIEPSRRITPYEDTVMQSELAAAKRLQELAAGAGAEILLYNVWGQNTGIMTIYQAEENSVQTHSVGSKKVTRQGHAKWMHDVAERVSEHLGGVKILPAGYAFENFLALYSDVNLYVSDNAHPSFEGSYLAACTIFASIFNERVSSYPATHVAARGEEIRAIADATAIDGTVPDISFVPEEAVDENAYKVLILGSDLIRDYNMDVAFAEITAEAKGREVYCEYHKGSSFTFRDLLDEKSDYGMRYALDSMEWDAVIMQITRRCTKSSPAVAASEKAALGAVVDLIKANTENVFLFTLNSDSSPAIFAVDEDGNYYKTGVKETYNHAEGSAYFEELAADWANEFGIDYIPYGTTYTDYVNSGVSRTADGITYLRACCMYDKLFGEAVPANLEFVNGLDGGIAAMLRSYAKKRCLGEEASAAFNALVIGTYYVSHNDMAVVLDGITEEADDMDVNFTFATNDRFTFIQLASEGIKSDDYATLAEALAAKEWDAIIFQITRRATRSDLTVEAGEKAALASLLEGELKDYKEKIFLLTIQGSNNPTIFSVVDGAYVNTGAKETSTSAENAAYYAELALDWANEFGIKAILFGSAYVALESPASAELGYLKACCLYNGLFGKEVPETAYLFGLTAERAAELKALAKSFCFDEYAPALVYSSEWSHDEESHWHACVSVGHRDETIDQSTHEYNDGELTLAPAEGAEGEMTFTCTVCGHSYTVAVDALAFAEEWSHDEQSHWHACTTEGYETEKAGIAAHEWNEGEVTLEPTYDEDGVKLYTCLTCGATKEEVLDKLSMPELEYAAEWTTDENHHWHQCITEGFTDRVADYGAHGWDDGEVVKAATVFEAGEKVYTCADCGLERHEVIAKKTTFNVLGIGTLYLSHNDMKTTIGNITQEAHDFNVEFTTYENDKFHLVQLATEGLKPTTDGTLEEVLASKDWDAIIVQLSRRVTRNAPTVEEAEKAALASLLDGPFKAYKDKFYIYTMQGATNPTLYYYENGEFTSLGKDNSTAEENTVYYTEVACAWAEELGVKPLIFGSVYTALSDGSGADRTYAKACSLYNAFFGAEVPETEYTNGLTPERAAEVRAIAAQYCLGEYLPPLLYSADWSADEDGHWHACITVGHRDLVKDEAAHEYNDGEVTKAPTAETEGEFTYTCTICGHAYTQPIAALTFSEEWAYDEENHYHPCTTEGYETEKAGIAAHEWNEGEVALEPTYEEDGIMRFTCTVCGATKDEAIDKLNMPDLYYSEEWSTDENGHWHQCITEGYTDRVADYGEHVWNDGEVTKQADILETGVTLYTCLTCGATKEEDIEKKTTFNILIVGADNITGQSLPTIFKKLTAEISGATVTSDYITSGTFTIIQLANESSAIHTSLAEKLDATEYDVIVIQLSRRMTRSDLSAEAGEKAALETLLNGALAGMNDKIYLYSYPGSENPDIYSVVDGEYVKTGEKETSTAAENAAYYAEVACAWEKELGVHKVLYGLARNDSTISSSTPLGYLQACSIFNSVFGKAVPETSYPTSVSAETKAYMRGLAETYCLNEYVPTLLYASVWSGDDYDHWHNCITAGHRNERKDLGEHEWNDGEVTKAPTAEEKGELTFTCTVCGHAYTQPIAALTFAEEWSFDNDNHWHACTTEGYEAERSALAAHEWNEGEVTLEPTYEENGNRRYACTVCGATRDEVIDKLNMPELTYSEEWTSDGDGHWHACLTAGYTDRIADYGEHDWNDGEVTASPTVLAEGNKRYTCTVCGATKDEAIEKKTTFNLLVIGTALVDDHKLDVSLDAITQEAKGFETHTEYITSGTFRFKQLNTSGSATNTALATKLEEREWDAIIIQLSRAVDRSDLSVENEEKAALDSLMDGVFKGMNDKLYIYILSGSAKPTAVEHVHYMAELACAWSEEHDTRKILYGLANDELDVSGTAKLGYLQACCIYNAVFGLLVPDDLTFTNELDAETAAALRGAAKTFCYDEYVPALVASAEWSSDDYDHWNACVSVGHRGEKMNEAAHTYDDGEITKAPTAETEGELTFTCTVCGHAYTQPIAALTFAEEWSFDDNDHWHACTTEGYEAERSALAAHAYDDGEVVIAATEDEDGLKRYTCTVCGATKDEVIDKLSTPELEYASEWTTDENGHWHACLTEGYSDRKADLGEHEWETVTVKPSAYAAGSVTYTCSVCGRSYNEAIAKNENYNLLVIGTEGVINNGESESNSYYYYDSIGQILATDASLTTNVVYLTIPADEKTSYVALKNGTCSISDTLATALANTWWDAIVLQLPDSVTTTSSASFADEKTALGDLLSTLMAKSNDVVLFVPYIDNDHSAAMTAVAADFAEEYDVGYADLGAARTAYETSTMKGIMYITSCNVIYTLFGTDFTITKSLYSITSSGAKKIRAAAVANAHPTPKAE